MIDVIYYLDYVTIRQIKPVFELPQEGGKVLDRARITRY